MSIRIGILGYGNLGRGVECAVKHNPDLELVAVFTRRDPASVKILTDTAKVYHVDEAEKMKDKIIAYGKEYIDNFKQNPLSATAILTMQIIFILGWGTFYMFLCERYIKYIIPGRTYTKSAIYPEAFSLTVIAFVFLFFICKSFKTLFLNNNLLKPKLIILALSLLCAISAYPLQLLLIEAVSFLPQTSVAFWAN